MFKKLQLPIFDYVKKLSNLAGLFLEVYANKNVLSSPSILMRCFNAKYIAP